MKKKREDRGKSAYFVGLDLGQIRDYTALSILEQAWITGKRVIFAPNGSEAWSTPAGSYVRSSPVVRSDGTVYVGAGSNLLAVDSDGSTRWTASTGNSVDSTPAIGADGTIYVGAEDYKLYAVGADGSLKWCLRTGSEIWSSPVIGADGTIYVGSRDGNLYAIEGSSGGLQDAPWPMFHQNVQHTGVAEP